MFARITGVGCFLPEMTQTNEDLIRAHGLDSSDEWVRTRTGIGERRVAEGLTTALLAAKAAQQALLDAGIAAEDLDHIIVATSTGDNQTPSTACMVQYLICASCPAEDVSAGCTGFLYALEGAAARVESGRAKKILVIGAERLTASLNYSDRGTAFLFGDGAGAVVIEGTDDPGSRVFGIRLGSDGESSNLIRISHGGFVEMQGRDVFKYVITLMPRLLREFVVSQGIELGDVDHWVAHQANQRILDKLASELGIDETRMFSNIVHYGNTSAASIPICLTEMKQAGILRTGQLILTCAFGAGMTWGMGLIKW
jgi:3-oxoacyl-[acyl-carrier-protein] synthase-3